jgi:isopenicillin-N epimerase
MSSAGSILSPVATPNSGFWMLDPGITYLNHGSFGSCPQPVLEFQNEIRLRLERDPIQFLVRDLETLLDDARTALANFIGAPQQDLALSIFGQT